LWAIPGADTRHIFTKGHIEYPMQAIFNHPMTARGFQNSFCADLTQSQLYSPMHLPYRAIAYETLTIGK
jgi:hypothetical protein